MGWLFFHKEAGVSTYDALKRDFPNTLAQAEAHATTSDGFYAVIAKDPADVTDFVRSVYEPCPDGKLRMLMVCMIKHAPKDHYNFGYKDMDELMGPVLDTCPVKLLDMLSPLNLETGGDNARWAQNFRDRCRARAEGRKARKEVIKDGALIETANPIRWSDGHESRRYRVEAHRVRGNKRETLVFRSLDNRGLYRIPSNLMDYGPTPAEVKL